MNEAKKAKRLIRVHPTQPIVVNDTKIILRKSSDSGLPFLHFSQKTLDETAIFIMSNKMSNAFRMAGLLALVALFIFSAVVLRPNANAYATTVIRLSEEAKL